MKFTPLRLFLFLCTVGLARATTPPAPQPVNDQPVMLSPYEVVANTVDFSQWRKLGSEHFILYTDAREKLAIVLLRHLEMLRKIEESFLRRPVPRSAPTIVVLPTGASDWKKIASKGVVGWKVGVSGFGHDVQTAVVVQYDWEGDAGLQTLYSALSNYFLYNLSLSDQVWFTYGVGQFFGTADFADDSVTIGRESSAVLALRGHRWIDWPEFFAVDLQSPQFTQENNILRYTGQTAVFVQFMLTNKDPVWLPRLLQWYSLLAAGQPPRESDFKAIMGQDWKTWQATLEDYLQGGEYQVRTYKIPPEIAHTPVQKYPLPPREMRELFVLTQIGNQHIPASDVALDSLLASGLKTPALRELLLDDCLIRNRGEKQLDLARALIADGTVNPGVYVRAADRLFSQRVPHLALSSRLGADYTQIEAWCRHALELEPRHVAAHRILAWTLALAPEVDARSIKEIKALYEELKNMSSTSSLIAALAVAQWRAGHLQSARSLAELLHQSPLAYKADRELATALLAELGPAAPAAPAPAR